jgi:hypothetical protein
VLSRGGMGRLIRATVPERNWERAAARRGAAAAAAKAAVSLGERFAGGEGIARGGYVLQRILKYFNCSGSRGTL